MPVMPYAMETTPRMDKCATDGSANHGGDKRLHAGEVDAVDGRLSDAEEAGDTGGSAVLFFMLRVFTKTARQAAPVQPRCSRR